MNIGQRIKERRLELGMTADELGAVINKSRATIYRYENGDVENMPTPILEPLAAALKTTPAELMGWKPINEPTQNEIKYAKLSIAVDLFDSLSEFGQAKALEHMEMLQKIYPKEELLLNAAHERTDIKVTDAMRKHDDDIMDDDDF